jgi:predicted nucleotidyltransferase
MHNIGTIIKDLTDTLKVDGVDKIILFGSYANGEPDEDSDLDIIVITSDDFLPASNREKMVLHHKYNFMIRQFRKIIPIDLLVYTRLMFQKLKESGSIFSSEINTRGIVLYESNNP